VERVVAGLLVLALAAPAQAGTWAVHSVVSYHVKRGHHNEFNPGVGIETDLSAAWRAGFGYYRNSNWKDSFYAAAVWLPLQKDGWNAGVMAGAVTGYEKSPAPMAGLVLGYEGKEYGVNLIAFPKDKMIYGVQVKWRFD
jgi:hypothetical protein